MVYITIDDVIMDIWDFYETNEQLLDFLLWRDELL